MTYDIIYINIYIRNLIIYIYTCKSIGIGIGVVYIY